jgi:hypothetical protein
LLAGLTRLNYQRVIDVEIGPVEANDLAPFEQPPSHCACAETGERHVSEITKRIAPRMNASRAIAMPVRHDGCLSIANEVSDVDSMRGRS